MQPSSLQLKEISGREAIFRQGFPVDVFWMLAEQTNLSVFKVCSAAREWRGSPLDPFWD